MHDASGKFSFIFPPCILESECDKNRCRPQIVIIKLYVNRVEAGRVRVRVVNKRAEDIFFKKCAKERKS